VWIVVVVSLIAVAGYIVDLIFKRLYLVEGEMWKDRWNYVQVGCIIVTFFLSLFVFVGFLGLTSIIIDHPIIRLTILIMARVVAASVNIN
jgi:hypothetical protein